ncbi:MAG: hypothetical protein JKY54_05010 [Flavobacteriales bacterium]|nr:hypothetical protein [Flavobacteriales bacterium]
MAQIAELYPLGTNFYIMEVGTSYQWTVEAFGGDYFDLSSETVVSPFPDYSLANKEKDLPLVADIVAPTIEALYPLIGANGDSIRPHIEFVAEEIMQELYRHDDPNGNKSPTMADYLEITESGLSHYSGVHKDAVKVIKDNLTSFLGKTAGRNFANADSINFDNGIVGLNFKQLMQNEQLAKFLLVFISLRFKQIAFANSIPARIIIDELHEFVRIDPELMAILIKQLTRMGRKEQGSFHGISQELGDIEIVQGILSQINTRTFLFAEDGHDEVARAYKMNDTVLNTWRSYQNPEPIGKPLQYRQGIRQFGDHAFDLHLKFPKSLLMLANSNATVLDLKAEIGKVTTDPFERLKLLEEAMA